MDKIAIGGMATPVLTAESSDYHACITIDAGDGWERIFLDYSEAEQLRDWLTNWLAKNQEPHNGQR